jgi:hypothetical protein
MEMSALAAQVVLHVEQHHRGRETRHVVLSGGVWRSPEAESRFRTIMVRAMPGSDVVKCVRSPLDGAVRLAESMAR